MLVTDVINKVATLADAILWNDTPEKFVFCIDELEISAHDWYADAWVLALEDRYMCMLMAENIAIDY